MLNRKYSKNTESAISLDYIQFNLVQQLNLSLPEFYATAIKLSCKRWKIPGKFNSTGSKEQKNKLYFVSKTSNIMRKSFKFMLVPIPNYSPFSFYY